MTESEYKAAHTALWDWLFRHPSQGKEKWPGWKINGGEHECLKNCFACDFCGQQSNCAKCPLSFRCYGDGNPYEKWQLAVTPRTRKKYAAMVRDGWCEGVS
jgi:hypothetical protein